MWEWIRAIHNKCQLRHATRWMHKTKLLPTWYKMLWFLRLIRIRIGAKHWHGKVLYRFRCVSFWSRCVQKFEWGIFVFLERNVTLSTTHVQNESSFLRKKWLVGPDYKQQTANSYVQSEAGASDADCPHAYPQRWKVWHTEKWYTGNLDVECNDHQSN